MADPLIAYEDATVTDPVTALSLRIGRWLDVVRTLAADATAWHSETEAADLTAVLRNAQARTERARFALVENRAHRLAGIEQALPQQRLQQLAALVGHRDGVGGTGGNEPVSAPGSCSVPTTKRGKFPLFRSASGTRTTTTTETDRG